jgi:hypothetical protein
VFTCLAISLASIVSNELSFVCLGVLRMAGEAVDEHDAYNV